MTQLNPYLLFNTNCREAMTFYKECLGGELTLQTIGESPVAEKSPKEMQDKIMHSVLSKDGNVLLMASDNIMGGQPIQGNTITLSIACSSEEEINTFFSNLSNGGKVTMPLATQFWGAMFGMCTDKYGMEWMFNFDKNAKK